MQVDIIGDIHGCFAEFEKLTIQLDYQWNEGIPIHPEGRKLAFVGDLTDRGPELLKVIDIVWKLVIQKKQAFYVPGNHCNKLYRYFLGNKVQIKHGLETTVEEYVNLPDLEREQIRTKFIELYEQAPLYLVLANGNLVIAHAGIREEDIGRPFSKVKTFVLYGDITGETHPDGSPIRRDWAKKYQGNAMIVYGHTPVKKPRILNNTYNIDTGAVFGGQLTALRYPEKKLISISSTMPFVAEKFRPIGED